MADVFANISSRTVEHPEPDFLYDIEFDGDLGFDLDELSGRYLEARPSRRNRGSARTRLLVTPHEEPEPVDAGEDLVFVPLIGCSAPALDGTAAQVTFTSAQAGTKEIRFSLFGNGPKRSVELSITRIKQLTVGPGDSTTFGVMIPVVWRQIQLGPTADGPLDLIVEPAPRPDGDEPTVCYRDGLSATELISREAIDARRAPKSAPQTHETSYKRSASTSMLLGAKLESIGLQVGLTISTEQSVTVDGTATTPAGFEYSINWLAGPPSLALVLKQ